MLLYLLYRYAFGTNPKRLAGDDEVPSADVHKAYAQDVKVKVKAIKEEPFEERRITARDGVELFGRYYHRTDGGPVVLMFHGYRSSCIRDGMGAFRFTKECGYNILMVDQRAHRNSGGKAITFGVKERYDCLDWITHIREMNGEDTKMILIGLSMGAATVMMATGLDLPKNVVGVIADCGYSSPEEILKLAIKDLHLPVGISYACLRLAAKLYGKFDPDSASAEEALRKSTVPVLMIHGEEDDMVPCEMSRKNYAACASEKELLLVPGAGHGMSYMTDTETYVAKFKGFLQRHFGE